MITNRTRPATVLLLLALGTVEARAQNPGRVFALLAIDTESHISGIEEDGHAMTSVLRSGFGNGGILSMKAISDQEVNPDVIVHYFHNVPSGPNDVLLFYYTGHGATFEGQGHMLTTSHGNLLRQTLVNLRRESGNPLPADPARRRHDRRSAQPHRHG